MLLSVVRSLLQLCTIPLYGYTTIDSSVLMMMDIYFQTSAIMNKNVMDILVHTIRWTYVGYIPRNENIKPTVPESIFAYFISHETHYNPMS